VQKITLFRQQKTIVHNRLGKIHTVEIEKEVEINLGLLEDDYVFDYQLDGIGEKEIRGVIRSCGCVGPALNEGDKWNFNQQPFKTNVSLTGKREGEGLQDFLISFVNDTAVRVKVRYVYLPLPSYAPEVVIFKKEEIEKVVSFFFKGEKDVVLESVELPPYFSHSQKAVADDSSDTIMLTFVLDRDIMSGEKDGVIRVQTSSKRKALFTIPYLVLSH
jgi:hypothetical protein